MSILDFRPVHGDDAFVAKNGAEPSLREIVYKYYAAHLVEEEAVKCAKNYCEQIEAYDDFDYESARRHAGLSHRQI